MLLKKCVLIDCVTNKAIILRLTEEQYQKIKKLEEEDFFCKNDFTFFEDCEVGGFEIVKQLVNYYGIF